MDARLRRLFGSDQPLLRDLLPSRRFVPQRVRALVDFLAGKFAAG